MAQLSEKIGIEVDKVTKILALLPESVDASEADVIMLTGICGLLQNMYMGMENILKFIFKDKSYPISTGVHSHKDLVVKAVANHVVSEETATQIRKYLVFRHMFVHGYAFDLDASLIDPLVRAARGTFSKFESDIAKYR